MISIIICSVNPAYLENLKLNILDTIAVSYELLVWDNKLENLPICKVYNQMAQKAAYPNLLFLHEDVHFVNYGWGKILLDALDDDAQRGVVGIAGSAYKSVALSGWYTGIESLDCFNVIHQNKDEKITLNNPLHNHLNAFDTKVLDGVFLACKKNVWEKIKFNENLLKGFHFYDLDFSLRASFLYQNIVINNIELIHFTVGGDFGQKWIDAAFVFHNHFNQSLIKQNENNPSASEYDMFIFKNWLNILKGQKISFSSRLKWIFRQRQYIRLMNLYAIVRFLLYRPLRLSYIHQFIKSKS